MSARQRSLNRTISADAVPARMASSHSFLQASIVLWIILCETLFEYEIFRPYLAETNHFNYRKGMSRIRRTLSLRATGLCLSAASTFLLFPPTLYAQAGQP